MSTIVLCKVEVALSGMPPGLLMASKGVMKAKEGAGGKTVKQFTPEKEAELHAHWTKVGNKRLLAIPWVNLYRSFCAAASGFKWQGKRGKSMTDLVAATISCPEEMISLGTDQYDVFVRYVRIPPRTGAMVEVGRPLLREWKVKFTMDVDAERYQPEILKDIITDAGKLVGIGPWRPSLKGPYGKFRVDSFEIVNGPVEAVAQGAVRQAPGR